MLDACWKMFYGQNPNPPADKTAPGPERNQKKKPEKVNVKHGKKKARLVVN